VTAQARRRSIALGVAVFVCAGAAVAYQQRVVGGYSLDANTAVEGGGLNSPAWRAGTPGLERQRYSFSGRAQSSSMALGRPTYSAGRASNPEFVLGTGIGGPVARLDPRTGQPYFRADPLRVPQYDALRVRETIPRYGTTGVRAAGSPYRVQTPRAPVSRAPSTASRQSGATLSNRAYSLSAR
jgi:hypothetical protein